MTEYEKELSKRVVEVGDKFIFRGGMYEAERQYSGCTACVFKGNGCTDALPDCTSLNFIKVEK